MQNRIKNRKYAKRTLICFCIIINSLVLISCGNKGKKHNKDEIYLSGYINKKNADLVIRQINSGKRTIHVDSAGGNIRQAINIGEAISRNNVSVTVVGACLSACAHFIFTPAVRKRVNYGAIVGYHGTATARYEYFHRAGIGEIALAYKSLSDVEKKFYRKNNISLQLLTEPFYQIEPICYFVRPGFIGNKFPNSFIQTRFSFFVPSLDKLQAYGVKNILGFWPNDISEMSRVNLNKYKLNATFKVEFEKSINLINENRILKKCKKIQV